ncbi:hypothetical protein ZOSMA_27G00410 [Zostera marina]|uniref:Uncharacterized protein n=1 Tax=Zostera marina TaxID=29655 RepID=A0A0K9PDD7_ZOSMR|nr:hypothetical protein ZOSMA_27G00410 [Zostera marina]
MTSPSSEEPPQLDRSAGDEDSGDGILQDSPESSPPPIWQREKQTTVEVTVATTNNNAPVGEISEIAQLINSESSEPNSVVEDGGNPTYYSIYNAHSSSSSSSSDESTVTTDGGNFPRRRRRRRGDRNRHGSRDRCVEEAVLVLIGCKSCMTYFMAEKAVTMECPSCDGSGEIVRFDR